MTEMLKASQNRSQRPTLGAVRAFLWAGGDSQDISVSRRWQPGVQAAHPSLAFGRAAPVSPCTPRVSPDVCHSGLGTILTPFPGCVPISLSPWFRDNPHSHHSQSVSPALSPWDGDNPHLHHSQAVSLLVFIQHKNCSLFFLLIETKLFYLFLK